LRTLNLFTLCVTFPALLAAAPLLEKQDLFVDGQAGYPIYRIPGLVVTRSGALLAYAEGRTGSTDWSSIALLVRRSTDGGRTWSPARSLGRLPAPVPRNPFSTLTTADPPTLGNPTAIAARDGAVHLLFVAEYQHAYYMRSDDDGLSFSAPVDITAAFEPLRRVYPWRVIATGPGHGIELRNHRLLVPVWLSSNDGSTGVPATLYSDDRGRTWYPGELAVPPDPAYGALSENAAVQLSDGRVLLNIRNESTRHRRLLTWSPDGATRWSRPVFHDQLLEPICMAGFVRLKGRKLLFSNPDNLDRRDGRAAPGKPRDRRNLTVKLSLDDGATWPVTRVLEPARTGYSDLAVSPHGRIYCFYERRGALALAIFNEAWLTE
jgi:sialidase-1